jgi:TetR/AcrR family transcriptional repressor of nem operon
MKASGLTVGGFYKHFGSKDDLLVQAIEEGMNDFGGKLFEATKHAPPGERWKEIVKWYLSVDHCERSDIGCPMASLAPEIARAAPAVKKRILSIMKARREHLLEFMPGKNAAEKERNFAVIFTAMAGAVSMARIMTDPAEKEKILSSVRDHLLESI